MKKDMKIARNYEKSCTNKRMSFRSSNITLVMKSLVASAYAVKKSQSKKSKTGERTHTLHWHIWNLLNILLNHSVQLQKESYCRSVRIHSYGKHWYPISKYIQYRSLHILNPKVLKFHNLNILKKNFNQLITLSPSQTPTATAVMTIIID